MDTFTGVRRASRLAATDARRDEPHGIRPPDLARLTSMSRSEALTREARSSSSIGSTSRAVFDASPNISQPTLSNAANWLSDRAGRHSLASPANPAPAFHPTGPADCGANSTAGRRFRRRTGTGRPHAAPPLRAWPRAVRGSPGTIAGGPVDDSRNDGSRPSRWTTTVADSARSGDGFEGHAASGGSSENARRPRRASV